MRSSLFLQSLCILLSFFIFKSFIYFLRKILNMFIYIYIYIKWLIKEFINKHIHKIFIICPLKKKSLVLDSCGLKLKLEHVKLVDFHDFAVNPHRILVLTNPLYTIPLCTCYKLVKLHLKITISCFMCKHRSNVSHQSILGLLQNYLMPHN